MSPECLIKQKELVSEEVIKLLPIYQSRGEKIIFEGMLFSDTFINDYLSQKSYLKIFIDNQIDLRHKVEWKQETRSVLSVKNEMDKFDYNSTLYHDHEDRIIEIHTQMKEICSRSNFHIVSFTDIVDGKAQCDSIVEDY